MKTRQNCGTKSCLNHKNNSKFLRTHFLQTEKIRKNKENSEQEQENFHG